MDIAPDLIANQLNVRYGALVVQVTLWSSLFPPSANALIFLFDSPILVPLVIWKGGKASYFSRESRELSLVRRRCMRAIHLMRDADATWGFLTSPDIWI